MIPVAIKHSGHFLNHGTDPHHIQIAELGIFPGAEVFVGDVAPTDDGNLVIDGERLVVHAAIDALEVRQSVQAASAGPPKGVEDTDLKVGVRIEPSHASVVALGKDVVEQQAYPHPAISRP